MKDITICMTYFKSLELANLSAALHSVCCQDLSRVDKLVLLDNDTPDSPESIAALVEGCNFPMPVQLLSYKHGRSELTHAWSTNTAVAEAGTAYVFFTRADYLLSYSLLQRSAMALDARLTGHTFVTAHGSHLYMEVAEVEATRWRTDGPDQLSGATFDYTNIDSGVWMTRKDTFDLVGGLDEHLTAWGHSQTEFQHRLHLQGVEFVRIPWPLFFHPRHGGPRDMDLAHAQLRDRGYEAKDLWQRYQGASPYR
jgi:hypothetical protein